MSKYKTLVYNGRLVRVRRTVYRFFLEDQRQMWRQGHWDRNHRDHFDISRNDLDRHLRDRIAPFEDQVDDADEVALIRRFLDTLPETQQRRVRMYFDDGFTYEQIAVLEGVHYFAVWKSIDSAIKKLRNLLISG